jgi:flagellar biosynthesis GTPase FlhF
MNNGSKTFTGKSLDEVIPRIRAELGEDAVVLRRRDGLVGGIGGFFQRPFVEVEATKANGAEPAAELPRPRVDVYDEEPADPPASYPGADLLERESEDEAFEPDFGDAFRAELTAAQGTLAAGETLRSTRSAARATDSEALVDELRGAGISPETAEPAVAEAAQHLAPFAGSANLRALARRALAGRIPVAPPAQPGGRVVAFAGAGGSGKSFLAERLAAAYASGSELGAVYLAFRTEPGSAAESLPPLGVPVLAVSSTSEARAAAAAHRDNALVVIDTPSAPRDVKALAALAGQVKRIGGVELHAVVPATLSRRAAEELLGRLGPFKPTRLALTHADETGHIGPAVDLALATGIPFSYVADGPTLAPADPNRLAAAVLP